MIWLILLASFSLPLVVALIAMRMRAGWLVWMLLVLGTGVMIWALIRAEQASGWDGLGYAIIALAGAAPAILGTLIGAGAGWFINRHAAKRLAVQGAPD